MGKNKVEAKEKVLKAQEKSATVPGVIEANEVPKAAAALLCCPDCGKGCRTKLALSEHLRTHKKK